MITKVKIVYDTMADLPIELRNDELITAIPLKALLNDKEYLDGVDITNEEFYELVEQSKEVAKTSQATYIQFKETFEKLLNQGYEVVYVGGSSKSSGTFQSAYMASNDLNNENLYLFDSLNISLGGAIQVTKAYFLAKKGFSAKEIIQELENTKDNVNVMFSVDTLDYLKKGGRISSSSATIGTLLSIKPILTVLDGKPEVIGKCRGKKQTIAKMVQLVKDKYNKNSDFDIILVGYGKNIEDALILKEKLMEFIDESKILMASAGLSTTSHCGSNIFGLSFI